MQTRDKALDRLRAFAIFWVLVVHVLYWGKFLPAGFADPGISFCLIEMPLFFFITGAGSGLHETGGYFRFVFKRFQRILIPYWVYAFLCAVCSILLDAWRGGIDLATGGKVLLSWILPTGGPMTNAPYLGWAMWFIPVYLGIVLILPALKAIKRSFFRFGFALLLLGSFGFFCTLKYFAGGVRTFTFYTLWTYLGLFYPAIKSAVAGKLRRCGFAIAAVLFAFALWGVGQLGYSLDMQENKFPPNIRFFLFSGMAMSLLLFALPYFDRAFRRLETIGFFCKIIDLFSKRSLTVFLYQSFAFALTIRLANLALPGHGVIAGILKSLLCLLTTVAVCAGLAALLGRIERIKIKRLEVSHEKSH